MIDLDLDLTVVYHTASGGSSGNNNDNSINKIISIDGMGIVQQFIRSHNGHIVAVNESCLFPVPSATAAATTAIVLCPRVVNTLTEAEVAEQNILEYGMVFDVTAWLYEHPGVATIIPRQALNIDSSRFFELYHASRESCI